MCRWLRPTGAILLEWLTDHYAHPYPASAEKTILIERTGLEIQQLSNWFTNARKRIWNPSANVHASLNGAFNGSSDSDGIFEQVVDIFGLG